MTTWAGRSSAGLAGSVRVCGCWLPILLAVQGVGQSRHCWQGCCGGQCTGAGFWLRLSGACRRSRVWGALFRPLVRCLAWHKRQSSLSGDCLLMLLGCWRLSRMTWALTGVLMLTACSILRGREQKAHSFCMLSLKGGVLAGHAGGHCCSLRPCSRCKLCSSHCREMMGICMPSFLARRCRCQTLENGVQQPLLLIFCHWRSQGCLHSPCSSEMLSQHVVTLGRFCKAHLQCLEALGLTALWWHTESGA